MVIESMHYNSECTCKSCRQINKHTNPTNSQISWEGIENEFDELIKKNHYKWCVAHDEGQFCHLDDDKDNTENIIPIIKSFLRSKIEEAEKRSYKAGFNDGIKGEYNNIRSVTTKMQVPASVVEEIRKQGYREGVEAVSLEPKYAQTTPMVIMKGNLQNTLLRQHVEGYNTAVSDLEQLKTKLLNPKTN